MLTTRYNKVRHDFGKIGEKIVLPMVEMILGETLTPTEKFYDTMDAVSNNYWVEIKTRSDKYHWEQPLIEKEGWLIPACKIDRALREDKKCCFYYYWTSDESLWEMEFSLEKIEGLVPAIPWWHAEKQLHYYIPRERWTLIEFITPDDSSGSKE
jgi:hypothetical protein